MKRWPNKPLGEVCSINPKLVGSDAPGPNAVVTFVPMAAVDEVSGTIARPERRQYSEVAKGYTPFMTNDVLFAKITPCMQNGKAAVATNLHNGIGFGSTEFHVLRSTGSVLPRWVFAFIRQPAFRSAAETSFIGSAGQQRVPADFLKASPIPIPPLAEQERIVKLLDEADELRKLRAQADRRTADLIPSLFHEMFGNPVTNSLRLPSARLEDIASVERGRFSPRPRNDPSYYGGEYPFIQTGDIADSGGFLTRWKQTLNERGRGVSKEFPLGTIVIAIVGATIGQTAILGQPVYATDSVVGIQPKPHRALPEYVIVVLQHWRPIFLAQAPETARANLNAATLKALEIPVPPLPLQKEFAARVSDIRAMQAEQAASRRRLDDLFQSMLYRAFQGQL